MGEYIEMNKKWKNSFGLILIVCIFSLALNGYMAVWGGIY